MGKVKSSCAGEVHIASDGERVCGEGGHIAQGQVENSGVKVVILGDGHGGGRIAVDEVDEVVADGERAAVLGQGAGEGGETLQRAALEVERRGGRIAQGKDPPAHPVRVAVDDPGKEGDLVIGSAETAEVDVRRQFQRASVDEEIQSPGIGAPEIQSTGRDPAVLDDFDETEAAVDVPVADPRCIEIEPGFHGGPRATADGDAVRQ